MSSEWTKKAIIVLAFVVGLGGYVGTILWVGAQSLGTGEPPTYGQQLTALITGVGGALATNFGAFMGISKNQTGGFAAFSLPHFELPTVQAAAAAIYFLSLCAAAVFALLETLGSHPVPDLIGAQAATLVGAIIGIIVVNLNTKSQ